MKLKGISLSLDAQSHATFDNVKNLLLNSKKGDSIQVNQLSFKWTPTLGSSSGMVTQEFVKKITPADNSELKGCLAFDGSRKIYPFGYVLEKEDGRKVVATSEGWNYLLDFQPDPESPAYAPESPSGSENSCGMCGSFSRPCGCKPCAWGCSPGDCTGYDSDHNGRPTLRELGEGKKVSCNCIPPHGCDMECPNECYLDMDEEDRTGSPIEFRCSECDHSLDNCACPPWEGSGYDTDDIKEGKACWGCHNDCLGQRDHMGPGGCLENASEEG